MKKIIFDDNKENFGPSREKAIIFCSTVRKESKNTIDNLINYCSDKNLEVIKIYSCTPKNANTNINDMLTFVREQTGKIHIVTKSLYFNFCDLFTPLVKNGKVTIHSYNESLIIDKNHSCLMMILNWYCIPWHYNNIKKAQICYLKQGYLMHLAPIGYRNVRDTFDHPDVVVEPKVASIIAKLFIAYETELYTINELTELAHTLGLKNKKGELVSKTCVNDILKNPFYAGLMRWKGKLYPHNYPTIIHKSSFDRVQEILKKRSHRMTL